MISGEISLLGITFNINPNGLEEAFDKAVEEGLTPKAIISVDLFGLPARFRLISEFAKGKNLFLLEDAAQGFGGSIGDQKACSFGDVSATSFFPAKPLGCYGDGGAIFTNNDELAGKMESIRIHGGGENKYDNIKGNYLPVLYRYPMNLLQSFLQYKTLEKCTE